MAIRTPRIHECVFTYRTSLNVFQDTVKHEINLKFPSLPPRTSKRIGHPYRPVESTAARSSSSSSSSAPASVTFPTVYNIEYPASASVYNSSHPSSHTHAYHGIESNNSFLIQPRQEMSAASGLNERLSNTENNNNTTTTNNTNNTDNNEEKGASDIIDSSGLPHHLASTTTTTTTTTPSLSVLNESSVGEQVDVTPPSSLPSVPPTPYSPQQQEEEEMKQTSSSSSSSSNRTIRPESMILYLETFLNDVPVNSKKKGRKTKEHALKQYKKDKSVDILGIWWKCRGVHLIKYTFFDKKKTIMHSKLHDVLKPFWDEFNQRVERMPTSGSREYADLTKVIYNQMLHIGFTLWCQQPEHLHMILFPSQDVTQDSVVDAILSFADRFAMIWLKLHATNDKIPGTESDWLDRVQTYTETGNWFSLSVFQNLTQYLPIVKHYIEQEQLDKFIPLK